MRAVSRCRQAALSRPLASPATRSAVLGLSLRAEAMKINQDTVLRGQKVTLVPYTAAHVPRYVPHALLGRSCMV